MDYDKIGHESLWAFVRTVEQIITDGIPFGYVVAASDSGQLAVRVTEEIFRLHNVPVPPKLIAPIYRHVDKRRTILFDNTILADQFAKWRGATLGHVLFVDDEIWAGNTLNGLLDLFTVLNCKVKSLTIVAEDGGFKCDANIRGVPTLFMSTKLRIPDIYNAFSYTIPIEFADPIKHALADVSGLNNKQVMCVLLNLPVKDRGDGEPYFSYRLVKKAGQKVPDLALLQKRYESWLKRTIQEYASM